MAVRHLSREVAWQEGETMAFVVALVLCVGLLGMLDRTLPWSGRGDRGGTQ